MPQKYPFVLDGKKLGGYLIHVGNVSRGRFIEETNFELYLKTIDGETSENPMVKGKYFSGRGKLYKPWLDIYYYNLVKFKSKIENISEGGLGEKLFKHLSDLLPPGSHIMVVYVDHEETRKGLERGIPAPATPIGYLLWKSGFTWFKDWYFAEGGLEGDVKLQGNKPLKDEDKQKNLLEIYKVLEEFLKKEKSEDKLFARAREKAKKVIASIKKFTAIPKKQARYNRYFTISLS